jgi:hypothetical protein
MFCRADDRKDDPLAIIIDSRPVHESPSSMECVEMMSGWLKSCNDEHGSCPQQIEQRLPTRVIEVTPDSGNVRLVVSNGRPGKWAALSYCWGKVLPAKTDLTNFNRHCQEGIPLSSLTSTFRDAICLTRRLGIPYLWIDALCIIQNDSKDWESESLKMDYVYQYATVTIGAEAASDGSEGLFESMRLRKPSSTLPHTLCHSNTKGLQGMIYFRIDPELRGRSSRGPLSNRAWTMQEEILSPRFLRFSETQILWRCPSAEWLEWKPRNSCSRYMSFSTPIYKTLKQFPVPDKDWIMMPSEPSKKAVFNYWYMDVVNCYVSYIIFSH